MLGGLSRASHLEANTKTTPTVVVGASEKRLKLQHQERARAARVDTEMHPKIEAFFARNVRPRGALPPKR